MVKQLIPAIGVIFFLSSCTVFKSLNLPGANKPEAVVNTAPAASNKFLEDITVTANTTVSTADVKPGPQVVITPAPPKEEHTQFIEEYNSRLTKSEPVSPVQVKYASLLNTDIEALPHKALLENVDEWYGVHYRVGGNTKKGVDCSGFTVAVYAAVYGIQLPRVSREQYRTSRKISTTELQEGDLVFFSTRGYGVSHVGIYLGNNKFIHASVSRGVMVNSLFEPYYLQRFVGAGRIDDKQVMAVNN
jgi:cell wall-associated NlpC family hydrolase